MITVRPFQPNGASVTVAVGTTAAGLALPNTNGTCSVRCVMSGTQTVFLGFGKTEAEAEAAATTATGMPMLGNTVETFQIRKDITHVAVIGTEVSGNFYITSGESA
jgi:hypothetical protein